MTFEKIIQTIIGDTNDERAEGFLRFLSSKLWGLYNDYLMDKIKVAESEIVWNLNMPNAKENQIYNQTVEMPKVSSAQLPEVEILLDDGTGTGYTWTAIDGSSRQAFIRYYRDTYS